VLNVRNLTKRYNDTTVIEDLGFTLHPGERVCLLAPSGAGKTTLIHILSGLDADFAGTVETTFRRRSTVFQEPGLFAHKTVAENIRYPLALYRMAFDGDIRERYREWIAAAGLSGAEDRYPHQISGGMKQKTALVRAFLPGPDLVLMDEAFSWMDQESKGAVMAHLHRRHPETALLAATHAADEISAMAKTVMVFRERRLGRYRSVPVAGAGPWEADRPTRTLFDGASPARECRP